VEHKPAEEIAWPVSDGGPFAGVWSANGDHGSAAKAVDELRRDYPGLSAEEFAGWFSYASAASAEPIKRALQSAGWD
jgi:hypothetical protein